MTSNIETAMGKRILHAFTSSLHETNLRVFMSSLYDLNSTVSGTSGYHTLIQNNRITCMITRESPQFITCRVVKQVLSYIIKEKGKVEYLEIRTPHTGLSAICFTTQHIIDI